MPVISPEALGVLHYNGFTFPATTSVYPSRKTVIAPDGYTYKCSEYTITAELVISANDVYDSILGIPPSTQTDNILTVLRGIFSPVGRPFCFANWGFGVICLNGPVTLPNFIPPSSTPISAPARPTNVYTPTHVPIEPGPKVDIDNCEFIGYNKAVHLRVTFTFQIFDSIDASFYQENKIIEMSLNRSWTVNEAGYFGRETKGRIRFWRQALPGTHQAFEHEYDFIASTVVPPLPGYQRTQRYDPDIDNRGFSFTITDTPIESPLPYVAPIRTLKLVHSINSGLNSTSNYFNWWNINFTVDCEVFREYPKIAAFPVIAQMMLERMGKILKAEFDQEAGQLFVRRFDNKHLLTNVRISDEVTSNRFHMEFDWRCMFNLRDAINLSKILSPPTAKPTNTWYAWMESMFGIQGVSSPGVSLTTISRPVSAASAHSTLSTLYDRAFYYQPPAYDSYEPVSEYPPENIQAPYTNYIGYTAKHTFRSETNTYARPRGFETGTSYYPRNGSDSSGGLVPPGSGTGIPSADTYKIAPTTTIYELVGGAQRVGAIPAIPTLATYDGKALVEVATPIIELTAHTIAGGTPVFTVLWKLSYALPDEMTQGVNPFSKLNLTLTEQTVYEANQP